MMIREAIKYSFMNAKVRSLKGLLLDSSVYEELFRAKGYLGVADCLKANAYLQDGEMEASSFDKLIDLYYVELLARYIKIIDLVSGHNRELIRHLYLKYELENIKVILRSVAYQSPNKDISSLLFPLKKHQSVSAKDLLTVRDLKEFIMVLQGTLYHDPLQNSLYRFEDEGDIFPLEMALDLSYYRRLWQIIACLSRRDKKIASYIIGIYVDILNIIWIIRFKENYHFSPEEILNYTLDYGYFIKKNIRKGLSYSIDLQDIICHLEGTPYLPFLRDVTDPEIGYVRLLGYFKTVLTRNWCRFPFHIGTILVYIFFKEIEVRNLVTITEAKRLGYVIEDSQKYVVWDH